MNFNEFALKRDYDWELQHLGDLNLSPDQLRIAREKILKAKEAAERTRAYYQANKERIAAQGKKYYQANKEKIIAQNKIYRETHKEQIAARDKKYRENNKEKIADYQKKYHQDNKEEIVVKRRDYYQDNKEKFAELNKAWREAHKDDPVFKAKEAARGKEYRETNKEKIAAKNKKYRENNREKINARERKRYQANKEKIAAQHKKWRENNPDYQKKYYQQKKNQNKNESLIESLQSHLDKLYEGQYIWTKTEYSNKPLEVLIDPTSRELQDFLKDYPICKCTYSKGKWAFANGFRICHDLLDKVLYGGGNFHANPPCHFSINRKGEILGIEYGSCEVPLTFFIYDPEDPPTKKDMEDEYPAVKKMLQGLLDLNRKYGLKIESHFANDLKYVIKKQFIPNGKSRWAKEDQY